MNDSFAQCANQGTAANQDFDCDGIINSLDFDDDNDGILDQDECIGVQSVSFSISGGVAQTYNTPSSDGFIIEVNYLDNSFNMMINGVLLVPNQLQFTSIAKTSGESLVRFASDNAFYGQNGSHNIWSINSNNGTPVLVIRFNANGSITFRGKRTSSAVLEDLIIDSGDPQFNTITWNSTGTNTIRFSQKVAGPTHLQGVVYGIDCNVDIDTDNMVNSQDTDSDNDGCPDAVEGGATFTLLNTVNEMLTGGVDANGIPTVATATGQSIGNSQDNLAQDSACFICTDPNLYADNCDFDGDGIINRLDLDDDNDGILDVEECLGANLSCNYKVGNSSFELPIINNNSNTIIFSDMLVPNWKSGTNTNGIWRNGQTAISQFTAYEGQQWISSIGDLYQDICTENIATLSWSLAHRSISSTQSIEVLMGEPDSILSSLGTFDANSSEWTVRSGNYTVPLGQNLTRIYIRAIPTFNGAGNFIDDVIILPLSISPNIACDTDGDGILNSFDLDSDDDGCSDAIEGGIFLQSHHIINDMISGSVDQNGIPTKVSPNGQSIYESQDNTKLESCCQQEVKAPELIKAID